MLESPHPVTLYNLTETITSQLKTGQHTLSKVSRKPSSTPGKRSMFEAHQASLAKQEIGRLAMGAKLKAMMCPNGFGFASEGHDPEIQQAIPGKRSAQGHHARSLARARLTPAASKRRQPAKLPPIATPTERGASKPPRVTAWHQPGFLLARRRGRDLTADRCPTAHRSCKRGASRSPSRPARTATGGQNNRRQLLASPPPPKRALCMFRGTHSSSSSSQQQPPPWLLRTRGGSPAAGPAAG